MLKKILEKTEKLTHGEIKKTNRIYKPAHFSVLKQQWINTIQKLFILNNSNQIQGV